VSPKPNIFNTTSSNQGEVFINTIEDKHIPLFPDIPSKIGMDTGFFKGAAMMLRRESKLADPRLAKCW
jgi:hypothetical protein